MSRVQSITLNRKQVDQFVELVTHFKDVEWFEFEQDGESEHVSVVFSMFGNNSEPETTVIINEGH